MRRVSGAFHPHFSINPHCLLQRKAQRVTVEESSHPKQLQKVVHEDQSCTKMHFAACMLAFYLLLTLSVLTLSRLACTNQMGASPNVVY